LGGLLDAVNVDLKGFDEVYYRQVCGARLQPVCDAIAHLHRRGVWLEVATLIIPGINDSEDELVALTSFLAYISRDIPWHVWRFHPDYRMLDRPWTHVDDMDRAISIGRAVGLRYVYASNTPGDPNQCTCCPGCGALLLSRHGNATTANYLADGRCGGCGWALPGLFG
jgi:pyruvate formate lyase activating enzyme